VAAPRRPAATVAFTAGALACFAANSLLARAALGRGLADAETFTVVRLGSGAALLVALAAARGGRRGTGSWTAGALLLLYALPFSLAYLRIPTGTGAFLLFAAVQATMIGASVVQGARPTLRQWIGIALALAGLAALARPGQGGTDPLGAALMVVAGASWGVYSLLGRSAGDPLATTADNLARSAALAAPFGLAVLLAGAARATIPGLLLAAGSGALATGGGYSLWYAVVPTLGATRAAAVQLSVPALAAGAAVVLLGEPVTPRLVASGAAILTGIALTLGVRGRTGAGS
jgi:drug/metabolite transporter (DMT)-like permease